MGDLGFRIVMSVLMLVAAVVLYWVADAAASGKLKRNYLAGIRVESTMVSEGAWRAAHQRARGGMRVAALIALVTGLLTLIPADPSVTGLILSIGCILMLVAVVMASIAGVKSAKQYTADTAHQD